MDDDFFFGTQSLISVFLLSPSTLSWFPGESEFWGGTIENKYTQVSNSAPWGRGREHGRCPINKNINSILTLSLRQKAECRKVRREEGAALSPGD